MKSTPEWFDSTKVLQSPRSVHPSLAPEYDDELIETPGSRGRPISLRLVERALRRHWWQALLLWGIGSSMLMALAFFKVEPTYDASAAIRIEPGDQGMYARSLSSTDFAEYKETQLALLTSPIVLGIALTVHPELHHLPTFRNAEDIEAEIRQQLTVQFVPRTNLIRVSMSSRSPVESAAIVNAVVDAYLKNATTTNFEETDRRIKRLKEDQTMRLADVRQKRDEIRRLREKLGTADAGGLRDRNAVTLDQYRRFTEQLTDIEIRRIAAQARLDRRRNERTLPGWMQAPAHLDEMVRNAFYASREVADVQERLERSQELLREAIRRSRLSSDPARMRHQEDVALYKRRRDELWVRLKPRLEREIRSAFVDENAERALSEAESQLTILQSEELALSEKLEQMRIANRSTGGDQLNLEFARDDLNRAMTLLNTVEDNLNQLEFEASSPIARIHKEFSARPSNRPNSNNRGKIIALVPFVVGFGILVLFVFLERHAGRVVDPDELPERLRLQVIGVVPPLPHLPYMRSTVNVNDLAGRAELRARRRLEEFVQSLDHLRVALCAHPDPWGRNRHCVLITSACGSEGKTTLAAQLAERCVNAGLMTLLIDADLRSPTLSRMLDASKNPGLTNVLRGAVAAQEAIVIVSEAGGFHLLPAGIPRVDPSRLLQGDQFGKLLAQARESFDMIIVDAPPVLPVPDSLTIGRWTDGAVLAVRFDTSRFPLIERATQRLAHVGVPLIGAVVNGVRSAESNYGGYYASGTSTYCADASAVEEPSAL
jgi:capsular exopolysaccharide synthesis family protein